MDMRLFFSTFLLIFLAELGDKTQLAAMAKTATAESSKWTVFSAAAAALVLSTLIAVMIGSALTRWIPEHIIRMGAAILFVLFGVLLFRDALAHRWATQREMDAGATEPLSSTTAAHGRVGRVILRAAAQFEQASAADYRKLARQAGSPDLAALFTSLADEEDLHLTRLRAAGDTHGDASFSERPVQPERDALHYDVATESAPILEHAIRHELATAEFYEGLARDTAIPPLRRILRSLAHEERLHAKRLGLAQGQPVSGESVKG